MHLSDASHEHMEAKQYATKQFMSHWRNQRVNIKIPGNKWKWKHDLKSMGLWSLGVGALLALPWMVPLEHPGRPSGAWGWAVASFPVPSEPLGSPLRWCIQWEAFSGVKMLCGWQGLSALCVRPKPLRCESRVQDTEPPETSWPHIISISKSSPRDLRLNIKT